MRSSMVGNLKDTGTVKSFWFKWRMLHKLRSEISWGEVHSHLHPRPLQDTQPTQKIPWIPTASMFLMEASSLNEGIPSRMVGYSQWSLHLVCLKVYEQFLRNTTGMNKAQFENTHDFNVKKTNLFPSMGTDAISSLWAKPHREDVGAGQTIYAH